jgi:hypothetical protein
MDWEIVSAVSSIVTTIIIGATAIAAVSQIRQLRLSTQLEGLLALHREFNSPEMSHVRAYVKDELPALLRDERYKQSLLAGDTNLHTHKEFLLCNYWEKVGSLVREGVLDPGLYLDIGAYRCVEHWEQLRPSIELVRKVEPLQWESFDYMVGLSRDYLRRRGAERLKPSKPLEV